MGFLKKIARYWMGAPDHVPTITPEQVEEMKRLYDMGGIRQEDLAQMFGIDQSHVSRILSGKSHAEPK